MADTQRTLAQILALLADNTSGLISPQDIRDAVVTLAPSGGGIYLTSPLETAISDTVTHFPDLGTYSDGLLSADWSHGTNGRLQHDGVVTRLAFVLAVWSITAAANNKVVEAALLQNGAVIPQSTVLRKINTGADVGAGACLAMVSVAPGDYFQLAVRNTTDTANLTYQDANLVAFALPA